ncbi:hypothetical protein ACHQM5_019967 [Ranunculus cassubicifolius]
MDPSPSDHHRLFNRQRSIHQILGQGLIADVMLWRRRDFTVGILAVTLASWVVFEKSGYTLLSLVSSVLLLLLGILFVWSKSAQVLNRPPPPLPDLQLSEEMINDAASCIGFHVNALLSASKDISLGKDSKLFCKVAACLGVSSVVGGLTDFLTLGYTSVLILLTLPVLYEKYEDQIDTFLIITCRELQRLYVRFDVMCLSKIRNMILEKQKLS